MKHTKLRCRYMLSHTHHTYVYPSIEPSIKSNQTKSFIHFHPKGLMNMT